MKTTMIRKPSTDSALCTEVKRNLAREQYGIGQRDEVEDHAQISRMQSDLVQQVAGAGQRHQRIEQADGVAAQRNSQPKYGHSLNSGPYEGSGILPRSPE